MLDPIVIVRDRCQGKTSELVVDVLTRPGSWDLRYILCPSFIQHDTIVSRLVYLGCHLVKSRSAKLLSPHNDFEIQVIVPNSSSSNLLGLRGPVWIDDMQEFEDPLNLSPGLDIVFGTALACRPWLDQEYTITARKLWRQVLGDGEIAQ